MKKEIFAVGLLLATLIGVLVNIHLLEKMSDHIIALVEETEAAAQNEDWQEASQLAEEAKAYWDKKRSYTHIVIRHSKLDDATNAFCNFLTEVYKEDPIGVIGTGRALEEEINNLYGMEQLNLGTIF